MSVPIPNGEQLVEINAPSPPEDPPADRYLFWGWTHQPKKQLIVSGNIKSYGTFDFTNGIAPNSTKTSAIAPFSKLILLTYAAHPHVLVVSQYLIQSFNDIGMPCKIPLFFPSLNS